MTFMPLEVNGELVDDQTIRAEAERMRPAYDAAMAGMDPVAARVQLWDWARETVVEQVLLRQAAARAEEQEQWNEAGEDAQDGSPADGHSASESAYERTAQRQMERLIERITKSARRPANKEIEAAYLNNREQFWRDESVRVSHIVKNVDEFQSEEQARKEIDDIAAQLERNGADFATLADTRSDCPGEGGDLGWVVRGAMVPEFEEVVFELEPGSISPVFRTEFGFHIALVTGRRPAGYLPLGDVRQQIYEQLYAYNRQTLIDEYVDRLKETAVIRQTARS